MHRAFILCAVPILAYAQETIHLASIGVRVTDPSGAVIEGAAVTARQTETNLASTGVTNREGRLRFPYLKVGPYEVTVRRPGFADATSALTLSVGAAYDLAFKMVLGATETTVNVSGEATV